MFGNVGHSSGETATPTAIRKERRRSLLLPKGRALCAASMMSNVSVPSLLPVAGTVANPLRVGMHNARTVAPCTMVIFGATGDLTHRKLIPALYNLALEQPLPPQFTVVGVARRPFTHEQFRQQALDSVNQFSRRRPVNPAVWDTFGKGLFYHQSNFDDPAGFNSLAELLKQLDQERGTGGRYLFYLATPPSFYGGIGDLLKQAGLARRDYQSATPWPRIIVEKPFGHDHASAMKLNEELNAAFTERQIYRIDHYLGKETVQNIMVLRFGNGIFEPIWNRRYVDNVQITVAETLGIEGRGDYYEEAGAMRDMVQNHMAQLLTLVAMEPPANFDADAVRDEKVKVLRAIPPLVESEIASDTVRGQYGPGVVAGEAVPGYREEKNVDPHSRTETFVALKLGIDNWRWAGVPFYLRHGKRLTKRTTRDRDPIQAPAAICSSATRAPIRCSRMSSRCAFSPMRASRCSSTRRCRGRRCRFAASTWISSTAARSALSRRRRTSACCSNVCSAIRRSSRASTRRSTPGAWWIPSRTPGRSSRRPRSPATSRARGVRRRLMR